jgi:cell wall-associated NlpC family hydrolase
MPRRPAPRRRKNLAGPAVAVATFAALAHYSHAPSQTATDTSTARATGTALVKRAESVTGDPYVWGAKGPSAFDCSGLVQWSLGQLGVAAPPSSELQWAWVTRISYDQLRPGDLIFEQWSGDTQAAPGHVVIYAGDGKVVEAPHTGADVQIRKWSPNETQIIGYGAVPGVSY